MRKRMLITLALVIAVISSMQVFAMGVSAEVCNHVYKPTGDFSYKNYTYVDASTHTYDKFIEMECELCHDTYDSYDCTNTEGHTEDFYYDWYYNEICKFVYCKNCGATLHVGPANP